MIYGYIFSYEIKDIIRFEKKYKSNYNIDMVFYDIFTNNNIDMSIQNNLRSLLENIKSGDTIIVESFNNFVVRKNNIRLLTYLNKIIDKDVTFISIQEDFNTNNSESKYAYKILNLLIKGNTTMDRSSYIDSSTIGRRPTMLNSKKLNEICEKISKNEITIDNGAKELEITTSMMYRRYEKYKNSAYL